MSSGSSGQPPDKGKGKQPPWKSLSGQDKKKARKEYFGERASTSQNRTRSERPPAKKARIEPAEKLSFGALVRNRQPPHTSTPGGNPILIQGGGTPTVPVAMIPRLDLFDVHMDDILQMYATVPQWHQFTSELRASNSVGNHFTIREFAVLGRAIAAVSLAQQIFFATEHAGDQPEHVTSLPRVEARIPRALTVVIQQYGAFTLPQLGIRVRIEQVRDTVMALLRFAHEIAPQVGQPFPLDAAVDAARQKWWLPTRRDCHMFRWFVAFRLSEHLRRFDLRVLASDIYRAMFQTPAQVRPGWWGPAVRQMTAAQRGDWDWIFQPFPATAAAFIALFTGAPGGRRLQVLQAQWPAPIPADLGWDNNPAAIIGRVTGRWKEWSHHLNRFFYLSSTKDSAPTACGTSAQLSTVQALNENTHMFRSMMALSATAASLAVAFHPSVLWDSQEYPPRVINTCDLLVSQERRSWVQSDLRAVPIAGDQDHPDLAELSL